MQHRAEPNQAATRRVNLWSGLAGFGLAGLFDSVLLHRLLGWHHLLAGAQPDKPAGWHLRADALFDSLMLAALALAIAGLVADRRALARIHRRCVAGMGLAGFGSWNLADALVVHWALGLHRIRPAAETPILWDIGWLAAFGILPLLIGLTMRKTTDTAQERG